MEQEQHRRDYVTVVNDQRCPLCGSGMDITDSYTEFDEDVQAVHTHKYVCKGCEAKYRAEDWYILSAERLYREEE